MYRNIKFILIQPTHPGNIGAAARAIMNMGFESLVLVSPKEFPSEEATRRASGADRVLENAEVFQNFEEAIADCHWVFGLSGRERKISWPQLAPEEAAKKSVELIKANEFAESREIFESNELIESKEFTESKINVQIGFVFGSEQIGLTNEQLEKCHYQIKIPANPQYFSLNLAQAVQIVSYELRKAIEASEFISIKDNNQDNQNKDNKNLKIKELNNLSHQEMEGFYNQLEQTLLQINFLDPVQSPHLMTYLRRLFNKAHLDKNELQILRGILTAVQKNV